MAGLPDERGAGPWVAYVRLYFAREEVTLHIQAMSGREGRGRRVLVAMSSG